jgi:ketosteroid isomerase-like protein
LGYTLEIERNRARIAGSAELVPISLRATTIYRREDGEWRCVHRQADPITSPRSIETVIDHARDRAHA